MTKSLSKILKLNSLFRKSKRLFLISLFMVEENWNFKCSIGEKSNAEKYSIKLFKTFLYFSVVKVKLSITINGFMSIS